MADAWLKLHARAERELAKVLRVYLRKQNRRILKAYQSGEQLDIANETALLIAAVENSMLGIMAAGAYQASTTKIFKVGKRILGALSSALKATLKTVWDAIKALGYWADIAAQGVEAAQKEITQGVADSKSVAEIVSAIKERLKGTKARAEIIATTETTLALNAGALAAKEERGESGGTWRTKGDDRVRQSHQALDGKQIGPGESFSVGGHPAKYPGDPSLPASERAGCRCKLV
jgi:SPP1 gp7 family putative phage head morphogenesis protein